MANVNAHAWIHPSMGLGRQDPSGDLDGPLPTGVDPAVDDVQESERPGSNGRCDADTVGIAVVPLEQSPVGRGIRAPEGIESDQVSAAGGGSRLHRAGELQELRPGLDGFGDRSEEQRVGAVGEQHPERAWRVAA
jgi:hypothetical protein